MAKEMGISSVQRIWAENDLKPHLVKSFPIHRSHGPPKPFSSSTAEPKKFSPKQDANE
jgi:hypothetical protein